MGNKSQFGHIRLWFDKTTNNVWQNILFDLFEFIDDGKEDEQKEQNEKSINYNELLYHLCFNDQSHFGFEKIVALSHNLNIIQDTENITNRDFELMQMRGIENVEITNISEIVNDDKLITINTTKENKEIMESFNTINIQQALEQNKLT